MIQLGNLGGTRWQSQYDGATIQRTGGGYSVPVGTVVTLTGWYDGNRYYIVEYPNYYIQIGQWEQLSSSTAKTQAQAQDLINKLLRNNQYIFENNLLLSRYADRLNYNEKVELYNLQKRLEERDNMLREADVFSQMQEAQVMGYANYSQYLQNFMSSYTTSSSVGIVISTTTAIIIGVVVLGSMATAAYFAFKAAYEESVKDVELSREMLRIFEKYNMSEEDVATIQRETQGIVTKAVLMEKIRTTFASYKNIIIGAALAYVGYSLYQKYKK